MGVLFIVLLVVIVIASLVTLAWKGITYLLSFGFLCTFFSGMLLLFIAGDSGGALLLLLLAITCIKNSKDKSTNKQSTYINGGD